MKRYVVYTDNGIVTVEAEKITRVAIDNRLAKIWFQTGDKVVAEFYSDHIVGWAEEQEDSE